MHAAVYPEFPISIFKLMYFSLDILVPPLQQSRNLTSRLPFLAFPRMGWLFILPGSAQTLSYLKCHPSYSHSVKINCSFLCTPTVCCLYFHYSSYFILYYSYLLSHMQVGPFQRRDIPTLPARSAKSPLEIQWVTTE